MKLEPEGMGARFDCWECGVELFISEEHTGHKVTRSATDILHTSPGATCPECSAVMKVENGEPKRKGKLSPLGNPLARLGAPPRDAIVVDLSADEDDEPDEPYEADYNVAQDRVRELRDSPDDIKLTVEHDELIAFIKENT